MKFCGVIVFLYVCLAIQARPQDIVISTSVSATAVASVDQASNVRRFNNVATATAVQNNVYHILLPQG